MLTLNEQDIYNVGKNAIENTFKDSDFINEVKMGKKQSYYIFNFFNTLSLRFVPGKKRTYLSIKKSLRYILNNLNEFYNEINESDETWLKIYSDLSKDFIEVLFIRLYEASLNQVNNENFNCCSRYMDCSNEIKCIHPDKIFSYGCTYRRNLLNGVVFYGKNRNV